jgi:hypothetical protein
MICRAARHSCVKTLTDRERLITQLVQSRFLLLLSPPSRASESNSHRCGRRQYSTQASDRMDLLGGDRGGV